MKESEVLIEFEQPMLALAMIVKDDSEVKELEKCLKSVHNVVDGIFITGTNTPDDKIKKLCTKYGAEYSFFKWIKDFSAARNFNFEQVTEEYEYILWLDADDVVLNADKLPDLIRDMKSKDVDWLNLTYLYGKDELGNVLARQVKPRILKRDTSKWEKTVHECSSQTKQVNIVNDDRVVIDHRPKDMSEKWERNLDILMAEYEKDKDKTDPRTLFYIANTLYGMHLWADAAQFYTAYYKRSGWNEEKYFALHSLGHCLVQLGETDKALDSAFNMIKLFPEWSLGYFDLSEYYSLLNDSDKVVEWTLVAQTKDRPNTFNFTNDLDFELYPLGRLADAYLQLHLFDEAYKIASALNKRYGRDPKVKELYDICSDTLVKEKFVIAFTNVANQIRREDRVKATKLFDCLPTTLDDDFRIQEMRFEIVPPKNWSDKSVVFYCGRGNGENWAYPSIFTGIGGSEEMVIRMSQELTKLGYEVTVYNNCGEYAGIYDKVEYIPYYHFNPRDNYNNLVGWRMPNLFKTDLHAKNKIVWLHDLAYPEQFSEEGIEKTDKFIFLSQFHRSNMPSIPDEKIFISNNGIESDILKSVDVTKRQHSLFYGSSYDRSLLYLLRDIIPIVRKKYPDTTIDVCYGFNNMDRDMDVVPEFRKLKSDLLELFKEKGVNHHGRVGQKELQAIMAECQVMAYPSEFGETNMITNQRAQALDCYVIMSSQAGGAPERVRFGEVVETKNIYTDKDEQKLFAQKIIDYFDNPKTNNNKAELLEEFSYSNTAKEWTKNLLT